MGTLIDESYITYHRSHRRETSSSARCRSVQVTLAAADARILDTGRYA